MFLIGCSSDNEWSWDRLECIILYYDGYCVKCWALSVWLGLGRYFSNSCLLIGCPLDCESLSERGIVLLVTNGRFCGQSVGWCLFIVSLGMDSHLPYRGSLSLD